MTRDELARLMAQASQEVGFEFGEVPTSVEHNTLPETKMLSALAALSAAGYAVVPLEATEAMIQHAHCHSFISIKINAAIAVGNILKGDK